MKSNDISAPASAPGITTAARCTVVFAFLYSLTFVNVLASKKRALRKAKRSGNSKGYDRYASPDMRDADRLQANLLEWCPLFLGPLWSLAATGNLDDGLSAAVCWTYLGLRAVYMVLVMKYGVR